MAAINERFTYDELTSLLQEFDDELTHVGYDKKIELNPIGGFALLSHGLRQDNPYTGDIDCVSLPLDDTAAKALETISDRHHISTHWLNNDTVLAFNDEVTQEDIDVTNATMDARYQPLNLGLANIDVNIADIDTLAHGKALAVCDFGADRSGKDFDDLLDVFEHEGVSTYSQATKRFPFLSGSEFSSLSTAMDIAHSAADKMQRDAALLQSNQATIEDDFSDLIHSDIDFEIPVFDDDGLSDIGFGTFDEDFAFAGAADDYSYY